MSGDIEIIFDKINGHASGTHRYAKNKDSKKITRIIIDVYKTRQNPGEQIHTILHEIVHAATVNYLVDHKELAQKLEEYAGYAYTSYTDSPFFGILGDAYGFTNGREFIAEFFTDPEFREILKFIEPM